LRPGLATGVRELNGRNCTVLLYEVSDPAQRLDLIVTPEAKVAVSNPSPLFDSYCFREDDTRTAERKLSKMEEMPVSRQSVAA
jgi:hypothetical protein